jgi:hypothetical protein
MEKLMESILMQFTELASLEAVRILRWKFSGNYFLLFDKQA